MGFFFLFFLSSQNTMKMGCTFSEDLHFLMSNRFAAFFFGYGAAFAGAALGSHMCKCLFLCLCVRAFFFFLFHFCSTIIFFVYVFIMSLGRHAPLTHVQKQWQERCFPFSFSPFFPSNIYIYIYYIYILDSPAVVAA